MSFPRLVATNSRTWHRQRTSAAAGTAVAGAERVARYTMCFFLLLPIPFFSVPFLSIPFDLAILCAHSVDGWQRHGDVHKRQRSAHHTRCRLPCLGSRAVPSPRSRPSCPARISSCRAALRLTPAAAGHGRDICMRRRSCWGSEATRTRGMGILARGWGSSKTYAPGFFPVPPALQTPSVGAGVGSMAWRSSDALSEGSTSSGERAVSDDSGEGAVPLSGAGAFLLVVFSAAWLEGGWMDGWMALVLLSRRCLPAALSPSPCHHLTAILRHPVSLALNARTHGQIESIYERTNKRRRTEYRNIHPTAA
ncbi:hypothetical protein B0H19DRAFT_1069729 [Mycena capillaripes]|nr:hypothetical protein B0H19DRAFT_1069729 [Mycena capillaripes]